MLLLLTGNHHEQDPRLLLSQLLDTVVQSLLPGYFKQPQQHHQGIPGQLLGGSCCLEPKVDQCKS